MMEFREWLISNGDAEEKFFEGIGDTRFAGNESGAYPFCEGQMKTQIDGATPLCYNKRDEQNAKQKEAAKSFPSEQKDKRASKADSARAESGKGMNAGIKRIV